MVIGFFGGIPTVMFVVLFCVEQWRERQFNRTTERRAEALVDQYRGEATTQPRPSASLSGLREAIDAGARHPRSGPPDQPPHQGWRT